MELVYKIISFVENKIGELYITVVESDMFAYIYETDEILVTNEQDDIEISWNVFMIGYLKEEFDLKITANELLIYAVLHEIGHYKTKLLIDPDKYKKEINELPEDDFMAYRSHFVEYVADDWAVSFINKYPEVLKIK